MVSAFHVIENAAGAAESVSQHTRVEVLDFENTMRGGSLRFRFADDMTISGMKGVDQILTGAGWEEKTDESEAFRELVYEVDTRHLIADWVEENCDGA